MGSQNQVNRISEQTVIVVSHQKMRFDHASSAVCIPNKNAVIEKTGILLENPYSCIG